MAKRRSKEARRGKRRENRHERRQEQHSGGGEWDCVRIPDGLEVFKPEKQETYHIDVMPYVVGGLNKNADPGDEYFELSYPIYRNLGIDEKKFIAIGELCGQRDPVAEHFAALRKAGNDWDEMKIFKHTWRQLWLFFVHEQPEKGLQLFEGAYGTFGELLDEELKANEEEHIDNFDDPDGGSTLVVRFKAKSIGLNNPWILASKINFEEREDGFTADGDEKLAAEVVVAAGEIVLDDLLKVPDYDTLKKALDGEPMDDGPDDDTDNDGDTHTPPAPGRRTRKPKPEDEEEPDDEPAEEKPKRKKKKVPPTAEALGIAKGDEVEHDDHGVCSVVRVAKDGLTITIMDEDDEVYKGIDPVDVEPLGKPNGDDESAPAATSEKPKKGSSGGAKNAETTSPSKETDPDWDDDWDD